MKVPVFYGTILANIFGQNFVGFTMIHPVKEGRISGNSATDLMDSTCAVFSTWFPPFEWRLVTSHPNSIPMFSGKFHDKLVLWRPWSTSLIAQALIHWSFTHVPLRAALQELRQAPWRMGFPNDVGTRATILIDSYSPKFQSHWLFTGLKWWLEIAQLVSEQC